MVASNTEELGQELLTKLELNWVRLPPISNSAAFPQENSVSLEAWRDQMVQKRIESLGNAATYMDCSMTGAGKTSADRGAVKLSQKSMILTPTHEQVREIEVAFREDGIDVVAYPDRITEGPRQNCWNMEANFVEKSGLSVLSAACSKCKYRKRCEAVGFLKAYSRSKCAQAVIGTHKRAAFHGLDKMIGSRDFVAIHEDSIDVLAPVVELDQGSLESTQEILNELLSNPRWLHWFGDASKIDEQGHRYVDGKRLERRDLLYKFTMHLATVVDSLIRQLRLAIRSQPICLTAALPKAAGIDDLLWRAAKSLRTKSTRSPGWRALLFVATGRATRAAVIVDDPRPNHIPERRLAFVWCNTLKDDAVCWIEDATADRILLEKVLRKRIIDATPTGRLVRAKSLLQMPFDITRRTAPSVLQGILRGWLAEHPEYARVGVITHRKLKSAVRSLGEPFDSRIVRVAHFGSGEDRGSNTWHTECDLVIVAGTPRLDPSAIRQRLFQVDDESAFLESGGWGRKQWSGKTVSGHTRVVDGLGFAHPNWDRAHRSLVSAALIQAAGRGRTLLENGCDVLVLSTEPTDFPLIDGPVVSPLDDSAARVLCELTEMAPKIDYLEAISVKCEALSSRSNLTPRQCRNILASLEAKGLAKRVSPRGGWLPICAGSELQLPIDE